MSSNICISYPFVIMLSLYVGNLNVLFYFKIFLKFQGTNSFIYLKLIFFEDFIYEHTEFILFTSFTSPPFLPLTPPMPSSIIITKISSFYSYFLYSCKCVCMYTLSALINVFVNMGLGLIT